MNKLFALIENGSEPDDKGVTLASQIYLHQLIKDRTMLEIAKEKVRHMNYDLDTIEAGIHKMANDLSRKCSIRLFETLVDQKLFLDEREHMGKKRNQK